jgi:hypothetical protein
VSHDNGTAQMMLVPSGVRVWLATGFIYASNVARSKQTNSTV